MPRTPRNALGGIVYHVLNRGNERMDIFEKAADYDAFLRVLAETYKSLPIRLHAYCLMSNHWHLVLQPHHDGDLGRFMQRLTVTHVRRWREQRHSVGLGHLYQGTYKSFPVQTDSHFLTVCRYVERNALRAGLVKPDHAQDWQWSSAWQRAHMRDAQPDLPLLHDWPVDRPRNWITPLNEPQSPVELEALALSLNRGRPLGDPAWTTRTAKRLGLTSTLRSRGRPKLPPK
jgi:putative transposase